MKARRYAIIPYGSIYTSHFLESKILCSTFRLLLIFPLDNYFEPLPGVVTINGHTCRWNSSMLENDFRIIFCHQRSGRCAMCSMLLLFNYWSGQHWIKHEKGEGACRANYKAIIVYFMLIHIFFYNYSNYIWLNSYSTAFSRDIFNIYSI